MIQRPNPIMKFNFLIDIQYIYSVFTKNIKVIHVC